MGPDRRRGVALLAAAIVTEVTGTLLLPVSEGFSRPWPAIGVLAGYAVSIVLFSRALRYGLTLGIAYGTLTGCGLASATVLSTAVFGDPVTMTQTVGLLLILAGALALQRPGRSERSPS